MKRASSLGVLNEPDKPVGELKVRPLPSLLSLQFFIQSALVSILNIFVPFGLAECLLLSLFFWPICLALYSLSVSYSLFLGASIINTSTASLLPY